MRKIVTTILVGATAALLFAGSASAGPKSSGKIALNPKIVDIASPTLFPLGPVAPPK